MTYKTILALIQNEADATELIDKANVLGSRFAAHLIGFHADPIQVAYTSAVGFPDVEYIRSTTELSIERGRRIAALFAEKTEGLPAEWGNPDGRLQNADSVAHSVDLVLFQSGQGH